MDNATPNASESAKKQIPVVEGLFYQPSSPDEKPYLIGSKCTQCGNIAFPKIPVCSRCGIKNTIEEAHIGQNGKIDSFTIVWSTLPGFQRPSVQSLIRLDEGLTIWSLMTGCEPSENALEIGMDVELVIGKVKEDQEGNEIVSYQYRPIKKGQAEG
ncbi:Zn-ribbon domain-containing OB-fold protein [Thermodesulfobacteriota bacterium]